jgi:dolichol-phosphate mannosyltransferase
MSDRLIIVPTYNETGNIGELCGSIRAVCDFDILFVDDGSPDGTAGAVRLCAASDPGIMLLERNGERGLGRAYEEAFRRVLEDGRWKRIFMMDADLSHQPAHLASIDKGLDSSEMVLGSRYLRGVSVLNWSIARLNMSYSANKYIRFVTGMPFTDCTSGFRGIRAERLGDLFSGRSYAGGYAFLVEMLYRAWRAGVSIGEVPIVFVERRRGSSKISRKVLLESFFTPLRLRLFPVRPGQ